MIFNTSPGRSVGALARMRRVGGEGGEGGKGGKGGGDVRGPEL